MIDVNIFDSMRVGLASPEKIRKWSYGEVKKPETINYRTLKPERDGLFCEKIFGPTHDWECHCGKYKRVRYKGIICDRCGVEVTMAKVRRERMGHIELAAPVSHIWYFKGIPSRMGLILGITPKNLERVLYFASYIVLKAPQNQTENQKIEKLQLMSESELRKAHETYGEELKVGIGAEAIQYLLKELNLEEMSKELRKEIHSQSAQKRSRAIRRLEVVEAFRKSGNKPEWMILNVIPVIPPDLRPMVQLDGGRFATSDLNDLYRRVINRNNRLKKMLTINIPDLILRNEKRMLQEAVDALIDNGRRGRPVTGSGNRALKSLSDMLKGKQGRFRQNLLGKRVDYSGRSVIVVGPELKLHQCGLPKEMALELFKPFVMKKLSADGNTTIKAAKRKVERGNEEVWAVLEEVIKEHPVLLNRAPTLHRLGIQAFEPVLTEGRALKLHPLACTAYNADFDGDQMAIHLPLSAEAQAEARVLMLAANHILAPKDGKPIIVPTQDMVLGTYYLTILKNNAPGQGKIFIGINEAIMAYQQKELDLHAQIITRIKNKEMPPFNRTDTGFTLVKTSVGRLIFNEILPVDLRYYNKKEWKLGNVSGNWELGIVMNKKELGKLVAKCYDGYGATKTAEVIDAVKNLGYHYACLAGMTVSIADVIVPPDKKTIIKNTAEKVKKVENQFSMGLITEEERYKKVVSLWNKATEDVADAMMKNLQVNAPFNPIYMMADSGARGNKQQMRQLAGMRGLMADPSGKIIDLPITANFREGLSVSDYFISSHGARKGLTDTALRTADSGYLTRRLVDVAQDVIIREEDCDVSLINLKLERALLAEDTFDAIAILHHELLGRVTGADIKNPATGEIAISQDTTITDEILEFMGELGITELILRGRSLTAPNATSHSLVRETIQLGTRDELKREQLRHFFIHEFEGKELARSVDNHLAGDILSHSMIENLLDSDIPEIFVRNNNVRGIEVEAITEGSGIIESLADRIVGRVLAEDIFDDKGVLIAQINDEIDKKLAVRIADARNGRVEINQDGNIESRLVNDSVGLVLAKNIYFNDKVEIKAGTTVTPEMLPRLNILRSNKVKIRSVLTCKSQFGVCIKCYGADLANQSPVEVGEAVGIIAAQSIGEPGTQLTMRTFHTGGVAGDDITQGLPRVEELFEARKPKHNAIISEIEGEVRFGKNEKNDLPLIQVVPAIGSVREYVIPFGSRISVNAGDWIEAGTKLTEGSINPHDILRVNGLKATQQYLVYEVQKVYKSQGVEINDKHIEVMVRQMLHKVKIEEPGDTEFLPGEFIDINVFETANTKAIEEGGSPAVAKPILLGITKASLATDSFLSAASFQETTKVLMGDFPLMTETGTFIINGAERVIVSQLVRSPGVYYDQTFDQTGKKIFTAQLIPNRGAWLELETEPGDKIRVRIDRTRKMPVTYFLRALGFESDDEILALFNYNKFIKDELDREEPEFKNIPRALEEVYKHIRPNEPATSTENAMQLLNSLFFDPKRYDLAAVGRYKLSKKLGLRRRLIGKTPAEDIVDNSTGEILFPKNVPVSEEMFNNVFGAKRVLLNKSLAQSVDSFPKNTFLSEDVIEKILQKDNWEIFINEPLYYYSSKNLFSPPNSKINSKKIEQIDNFSEQQFFNLQSDPLHKGFLNAIPTIVYSNEESINMLCAPSLNIRTLSISDIIAAIGYLLNLMQGEGKTDDIDHLGNRRVRSVGELLQNQFRIGLSRMERVVRDRMTTQDSDIITPQILINIKPVIAAMKEFFGSSQLSQFMDQHNPLSELTHKRRLSALGPGGLSRERAGFEVRDVHNSHYGRMCPIETPEGPNIGLIGSLSNFARIDKFGFVQTPYRKVDNLNHSVSNHVVYMTADDEESLIIAQANEPLDLNDWFINERVTARHNQDTSLVSRDIVDFMDVWVGGGQWLAGGGLVFF